MNRPDRFITEAIEEDQMSAMPKEVALGIREAVYGVVMKMGLAALKRTSLFRVSSQRDDLAEMKRAA